MNKISFVFPTLLATAISSVLIAAPAVAAPGFYAELSAGASKGTLKGKGSYSFNYSHTGESGSGSESFSEKVPGNPFAYGIKAGYQIGDYFAVEVGHNQYGEWNETSVDEYDDTIQDTLKASSLSAGIKGILPINDAFSLHARLGIAKWDFKATSLDSSTPDEVYTVKDNGNDLYYGIGGEYNITETMSVGLEYSVVTMSWSESVSSDENGFSYTSSSSIDYKVENLSLLFKVSF